MNFGPAVGIYLYAAASLCISTCLCHHTALNAIGHSYFLVNSPLRWKAPTLSCQLIHHFFLHFHYACGQVERNLKIAFNFLKSRRGTAYEHSKFLLSGPFGLITVYNECWSDVSIVHAFTIFWNQLPTSGVYFDRPIQGECFPLIVFFYTTNFLHGKIPARGTSTHSSCEPNSVTTRC